jgi:predicted esterase
MKKWTVAFSVTLMIWTIGFAIPGESRKPTYPYSTYGEMRAEVGRLYQQQKLEELAALLEWGLNTFPDHMEANAFNLMLAYARLQQWPKGIRVMKRALHNNIWFGKYAVRHPLLEGYKKETGFQKLLKKNSSLMTAAQKISQPMLKIQKPETLEANKKYPLFIALHGGGENIDQFIPRWTSGKLKKTFFIAYPQSSQIISMNGYNWTEDIALSLREIKTAYEQILSENPVDPEQVYVGGFSSGGVAALELVLKNVFPIRGFVVLCPAKPDNFSSSEVTAARNRGVRGTLITTEMDQRLVQQREVIEIFRREGLQYQFIVTPNIGHWYPPDLDIKIDRALDHIDNR